MTQTAIGKTYNGFKNHQTWCVSLWLDNTERTCDYLYELANNDGYSMAEKMEEAKGYVEGMLPLEKASLVTDLLIGAFGEVDWREIISVHIE